MSRQITTSIVTLIVAATACVSCASADPPIQSSVQQASVLAAPTPERFGPVQPGEEREFPEAPIVPSGELSPELAAVVDTLFGERLAAGDFDHEMFTAILTIGDSGDARLGWLLADLMRIIADPDLAGTFSGALSDLLGVPIDYYDAHTEAVDLLIAWDVPAPPNYLQYKRNILLLVEPAWERLMVDGADVDWRQVTWGGVRIDDRPYDATDRRCGCIPAVDNPSVTDVAAGDEWLDDEAVVFGLVINGESRAYPRSVMEVREMVNDTLGGRDFAMPYCTLCGAAQVFFTDELAAGIDRPVLRTSGLLTRSNKVMFDLTTWSLFDTFRGVAVSGPLAEMGLVLDQHAVRVTNWGDWKQTHPETTVLSVDEALGRPESDLRNTRDARGPIFAIGPVDARLAEQEDVLGVVDDSGDAVAFHVASARNALRRGEQVRLGDVWLRLDGLALVAETPEGLVLPGHQAFWFAWSQFHPDTDLWVA